MLLRTRNCRHKDGHHIIMSLWLSKPTCASMHELKRWNDDDLLTILINFHYDDDFYWCRSDSLVKWDTIMMFVEIHFFCLFPFSSFLNAQREFFHVYYSLSLSFSFLLFLCIRSLKVKRMKMWRRREKIDWGRSISQNSLISWLFDARFIEK
jgi:hypothetical protein